MRTKKSSGVVGPPSRSGVNPGGCQNIIKVQPGKKGAAQTPLKQKGILSFTNTPGRHAIISGDILALDSCASQRDCKRGARRIGRTLSRETHRFDMGNGGIIKGVGNWKCRSSLLATVHRKTRSGVEFPWTAPF